MFTCLAQSSHSTGFFSKFNVFSLVFFCSLSNFVFFGLPISAASFEEDLVKSALNRTQSTVRYDGRYMAIDYPNGDVPKDIGVCTDVVIRSYRSLGIDLQQLVHEDMKLAFSKYPSKRIWGLNKPDSNIDHRRVPNLRSFFTRHGQSLSTDKKIENYRAGDLVTWMLPGNLPHIGVVTNQKSADSKRLLVVHNIGRGPKLDDMIFDFDITGHYRYVPKNYSAAK